MASRLFRRSLSIRSTLLTRSFNLSAIPYIDGEKREESHSSASKVQTFLAQRRSLGCFMNTTFCRTPYGLSGNGMYLRRGISTSSGEANEAVVSMLEVVTVTAASDSAFPVAAVQYLIDGVHTLTWLNWWASIAIATLLVHGATVPLYIKVLRKHTLKLAIMVAQGIMILRQAEATVDRDPLVADKALMMMMDVLKRGGISLYMGILVRGSIFFTFFLAVLNMAEKVPSFKTGGILWFKDLSTPDAMYIFPITMAFISIVQLELPKKSTYYYEIILAPHIKTLQELWLLFGFLLPCHCLMLYSASGSPQDWSSPVLNKCLDIQELRRLWAYQTRLTDEC